ncbi:MAG: hypothetical protein KF878_19260 [Planctomycetes bacterium]|nr:hypothetical protein [Planctomycetota bacterium]
MVTTIACALIGLSLLVAGLTKALDAEPFVAHVRSYGLLPERLLPGACLALVALEWGLGAASLGRVAPAWTLSGAALLLLGLTAVSLWAARGGRVQTCGCYGDVVRLTPRQNAALNLLMIGLAGAALALERPRLDAPAPWAVAASAALGLIGAGLGWTSLRRGPIVDSSAARPGRRWRAEWAALPVEPTRGTWLVGFLKPECTICRVWARWLERAAEAGGHDGVAAVVAVDDADAPSPFDVRLPTAALPLGELRRLVRRAPTILVVRDGVIAERWRTIPRDQLDLLRRGGGAAASPD